jgi:hypothetical protein|tara:strand:+ start:337 stop:507 length:171 start_codon:yes stop_codon:yes gene_type:complete
MTEELKDRINQWNSIKYPNDDETRIIIGTLNVTLTSNNPKYTKIKSVGTVTTAPKV